MTISSDFRAEGNSIAIVHGGRGDAQRYRCAHLQEQLYLYGIKSRRCEFRDMPLALSADCQLLIFHRVPLDGYLRTFVDQIRRIGVTVLFDTDDLVFDESAFSQMHSLQAEIAVKRELYCYDVRQYRQMLMLCDAALAPTTFLAQQILPLGKPAWVHRNAFSSEMMDYAAQAYHNRHNYGPRVVIGYASGTPTHDQDFSVAKCALRHVLSHYPQTALHIIGHLDPGDDWDVSPDRVRRSPYVSWRKLPDLLAQLDINIAPLESDSRFCQAKSELKYIEAGLVRVPTVASATDAFQFAIRPGDNGFLAQSEHDWVEALSRLVEDAALRREMGERAHGDVVARYHPAVRGRELLATLNQIGLAVKGRCFFRDPPSRIDQRRGEVEPLPSTYEEPAPPSLLWRAWYTLRYRGWRVFIMRCWVYFQAHILGAPSHGY